MMAWIPSLRNRGNWYTRGSHSPSVVFDFAKQVWSIIVTRWDGFNTPLHALTHALNPKFYDEEIIARGNRKGKGPYKDKEVAPNKYKLSLSH